MKICRARVNEAVFYAKIEGDLLHRLVGLPFAQVRESGQTYPLSAAQLLAPTQPSKIVCLGKNYQAHAEELGSSAPEEPLLFLKPSTSVINPGDDIIYPPDCQRLDYEAELAVVIGKQCKGVAQADYRDVIFGYTCLNDVTARDLQTADGQWTRSKGFDTFCPIGPWIETELNPADVRITSRLNGDICQNGRSSQLIHTIDKLIWYVSRVMTLLPGDIIATGTPAGIGPMQVGDSIEVEVEGIGILRNQVAKK